MFLIFFSLVELYIYSCRIIIVIMIISNKYVQYQNYCYSHAKPKRTIVDSWVFIHIQHILIIRIVLFFP